MRAWLLANGYAVSAVVLSILCILALAMVVQPWACANRTLATGAAPEAPEQPGAATTPQPTAALPQAVAAVGTPAPDAKDSGVAVVAPAGPSVAGGALLACSAGGDLDWSTTADTLQVICQCTLTLPGDGWAYLSAGGSLSGRNCEYEAHFRLGIDDREGDPASDRWANIYGDTGDGMDAVLALSALRALEAGSHTFYLLGRRAGGSGTVLLHDPGLAVLAWPAAGP